MRTDRDGAPLVSVDAEDAAQRADEGEVADRLLTAEATPDNVRPYAERARGRAAFHHREAERLDALADSLYRWIARQTSRGGAP